MRRREYFLTNETDKCKLLTQSLNKIIAILRQIESITLNQQQILGTQSVDDWMGMVEQMAGFKEQLTTKIQNEEKIC